jgi:triphosphoribosyl-dephospho-CoA synthase
MTARDVAAAAQLACLLEVSAPKPGNVSPGRHFADVRYEDFLASAVAIGDPLAGAGERPLGATIRLAIEATSRWAPSNTNLGIVLLLAPLARAAILRGQVRGRDGIRPRVVEVLEATTVDDARDVYAAIRLAKPGGLGQADAQDVAAEPTVTLLDAMRLAADRDGIAREYATGFDTTFDVSAPALRAARSARLPWDDAIVETFLAVLAAGPDTHVARRGGAELAAEVWRKARAVMAAGGVRSAQGRRALDEMDAALRDPRNTANPGTAADLTAAAIFVELLDKGMDSDASR